MIRTVSLSDEPGLTPLAAALEDEGFIDLAASKLMEGFARHLMVHIDAMQEFGFGAITQEYLPRLARDSGVRRDIDETGDLLIRRSGKPEPERQALKAALATPSWLDPNTGGPRA